MEKKKLKFVQDAYYRGELKYKKDQVVDVSNELKEADRWLKRRIAVLAQEDKKPAAKKEDKKPAVKKEEKKDEKKAAKKEEKKNEEKDL